MWPLLRVHLNHLGPRNLKKAKKDADVCIFMFFMAKRQKRPWPSSTHTVFLSVIFTEFDRATGVICGDGISQEKALFALESTCSRNQTAQYVSARDKLNGP